MIQPSPEPSPDYREREYQDPHYHDEDPDIQNDEMPRHVGAVPPRHKPARMPPPKRRYEDD